MLRGVRAWDAAHALIMDTNYRAGRILGVVDTGGANGSISHPGFSTGQPFWIVVSLDVSNAVTKCRPSVSGATMTWTYDSASGFNNGPCRIFYGVY